MISNLFKKLCEHKHLHKSWKIVLANGLQSKCKETQGAIKEFQKNEWENICDIACQLQNNTFKSNARAIIQRKKDKNKPRPIVSPSVPSRIVQRTILDILQGQNAIKKYLNVKTSFGAIPSNKDNTYQKKGVHGAIKMLRETVSEGKKYFIKSDIKSFFTKVSFSNIKIILSEFIDDELFLKWLEKVTMSEMENINQLQEEHKNLFDYTEHGVPQGCCLSPLYANITLFNFDTAVNSIADITCLRYLDDFVIFGKNEKEVSNAFQTALVELKKCGLDAYNPAISAEQSKAEKGWVRNGVDFLGVRISGNSLDIRPTKKKCAELTQKVSQILDEGVLRFREIENNIKPYNNFSYIETLSKLNQLISGWSNAYHYCNHDETFLKLDDKINKLILKYIKQWNVRKNAINKLPDCKVRFRRVLGVHSFFDRKKTD